MHNQAEIGHCLRKINLLMHGDTAAHYLLVKRIREVDGHTPIDVVQLVAVPIVSNQRKLHPRMSDAVSSRGEAERMRINRKVKQVPRRRPLKVFRSLTRGLRNQLDTLRFGIIRGECPHLEKSFSAGGAGASLV